MPPGVARTEIPANLVEPRWFLLLMGNTYARFDTGDWQGTFATYEEASEALKADRNHGWGTIIDLRAWIFPQPK